MYKIKTEKFNGPLDLLLQLIQEQKLEITEVSLAQVTEQYMNYLERFEDKDPEELADFLFIASRLLLIKSKEILPDAEIEEDLDSLEKQLKLYKEFIEASKKIQRILNNDKVSFLRPKRIVKTEVEFTPPKELSGEDLKKSFLKVLKKLDPVVKLPRVAIAKVVSLKEKIVNLQSLIKKSDKLSFKKLIDKSKNKTDVIISFLAVLEMVKAREVLVKQVKDDLLVSRLS